MNRQFSGWRAGKRLSIPAIIALLMAGVASRALAHEARPETLQQLLGAWEFDPGIVIPLVLSAALYAAGLIRFWAEGKIGRGIKRGEAACFGLGWLVLAIALLSPLHPWGRVLFSAHMTQHELLMLVSAPLLVLGRPLAPFLKALPARSAHTLVQVAKFRWWKAGWAALASPFVAWSIHAIVLWVWHAPQLFQATLENDLVHALQHSSFLFSALLFWWALLQSRPGLANYGAGILYLFTTAMHSGLLGALITLSGHPLYPAYAGTTQSWGFSPLEDQQLGGLIMWIPAGLVYVGAGLAFFVAWLRAAEARVRRREQEPLSSKASVV